MQNATDLPGAPPTGTTLTPNSPESDSSKTTGLSKTLTREEAIQALPGRAAKQKEGLAGLIKSVIKADASALYLRLLITLALLILRIADQDAYVEDLVKRLRKQYGKKKVPATPTLYHYSPLLLEWMRRRHPEIKNQKLTSTFLQQNPQYILNISEPDIEKLADDIGTAANLRAKYCKRLAEPKAKSPQKVQPSGASSEVENSPVKATVSAPATKDKPKNNSRIKALQQREQNEKSVALDSHARTRNHDSVLMVPTSDDLLVAIYRVSNLIDELAAARVPVGGDVKRAWRTCWGKLTGLTLQREAA